MWPSGGPGICPGSGPLLGPIGKRGLGPNPGPWSGPGPIPGLGPCMKGSGPLGGNGGCMPGLIIPGGGGDGPLKEKNKIMTDNYMYHECWLITQPWLCLHIIRCDPPLKNVSWNIRFQLNPALKGLPNPLEPGFQRASKWFPNGF